MIREKVTVNDYLRIAQEHEYYIWNFLQRDQEESGKAMFSYWVRENLKGDQNQINLILDFIDIPYFESYVDESIDFLLNLDLKHPIWKPYRGNPYAQPKEFFLPILVGFQRKRKITSTLDPNCYCVEGVLNIIKELNPEFLLNAKLD
jgi:hypothetical protein